LFWSKTFKNGSKIVKIIDFLPVFVKKNAFFAKKAKNVILKKNSLISIKSCGFGIKDKKTPNFESGSLTILLR
jgi:hypothetical protein